MIVRFEIVAVVVCAICIWLLLLSPTERENFPPLRFMMRLIFPKMDYVLRHRRISMISGVLLAVFALGAGLALFISRYGNR